jgi:hypothetical protein
MSKESGEQGTLGKMETQSNEAAKGLMVYR